MAFCSNCGARLIEGAVFCPECGTKNSFNTTPVQQTQTQPHVPPPVPQQPAYQPPPQPERVAIQFGALKFEVVEKETLKFLKVEFDNNAIRYESGGM